VDNLHERAGSRHIVHLHGELTKVRSERYEELVYELPEEKYEVKIGDLCDKGHQLRPHIVWFGEAVPMMNRAVEITETADILLIIGTSLNVYPAAGLVHYVRPDVPIYVIDPKDVPVNRRNVIFIKMGASEGVREFLKLVSS
jgi:NAD-dependent deacetylase